MRSQASSSETGRLMIPRLKTRRLRIRFLQTEHQVQVLRQHDHKRPQQTKPLHPTMQVTLPHLPPAMQLSRTLTPPRESWTHPLFSKVFNKRPEPCERHCPSLPSQVPLKWVGSWKSALSRNRRASLALCRPSTTMVCTNHGL